MKKIISILMTVAVTLALAVPVMANSVITVLVDGEKMEFDAQPEMVNERTMVPMRAIFEKLGAEVSWDQPTQTVTAVTPTKTVVSTIGEASMYVNGEEKVMDVSPYIKEERTYVPARFIAEALDCKVDWDQESHTVVITTQATDEKYITAYNAMKDFIMGNGIEDSGEWMYAKTVEDGTDLIAFVMTYNQTFDCINIGASMTITELPEDASFIEEIQTSSIINADVNGSCTSSTYVTVSIVDSDETSAGEKKESKAILSFENGKIVAESIDDSFDNYAGLVDEFWNIMDSFLENEGCNVSVLDFGLNFPG